MAAGASSVAGVNSDLHMSDVIEVITNDPDYVSPAFITAENQKYLSHLASSGLRSEEVKSSEDNIGTDQGVKKKVYVKILEQPASKALRFRYECEGRSAGSIPGANSANENKTYPTVQIVGYQGRAVIIVSCVTKDPPYRPHPHSLVGKDGCKRGVCTVEVNNETMIQSFPNLGIQCVKKKGIDEALKLREEIKVDPFKTGFAHRHQPQSIDLNAVRLCFQAFLVDSQKGKKIPLKPIVSDPIYDKKAMNDLTICKLSDFTSPVSGKKEIILLCEKVAKDDIQVRFYEERDGLFFWEGFGEFQACDVHKQVAISFRTPPYKKLNITEPVNVYIQLRRPSDKISSESRPFKYLPVDSDIDLAKRKRARLTNNSRLEAYILGAASGEKRFVSVNIPTNPAGSEGAASNTRPTRHGTRTRIKKEPMDVSSPDFLDVAFSSSTSSKPNSINLNSLQDFSNLASFIPNFPSNNPTLALPNSPLSHYSQDTGSSPRNMEQQSDIFVNDISSIQLPLGIANVDFLDAHLLENLSLTDVQESEAKLLNTDTISSMKSENQMEDFSVPELEFESSVQLPVLTFSGLLNSANLDSSENLANATIREIDALNALHEKSALR